MQKKRRTIAAWAACALWMAVIFLMSAAPGEVSGEQSGLLARLLGALLSPFAALDAAAMNTLETLIRKGAHMAEYAVLFLLYRWALMESGARRPGRTALLLAVCYAASDEFHQRFVPGRGPAVTDVMIDACGAMVGWGMAAIGEWIMRNQKKGR